MNLTNLTAGTPIPLSAVRRDNHLVQDIQRSLLAAGYSPGPIDGIWGGKTEAAAKRFCQDNYLNNFESQTFGKSFATALIEAAKKKHKTRKTPDLSFAALQSEYLQLWQTMQIRSDRLPEAQRILGKMLQQQDRYIKVSKLLNNMPWFFIACLHCMESSLSFNCHLHNGDSLTARTVQVPAGRPLVGRPPFSWEESAEDALRMKGFHKLTDWSVPSMLYQAEKWNGWGMRMYHSETLTPYLWSGSNHYSKGKYVKDGVYDPTAISEQIGFAILLKVLGV